MFWSLMNYLNMFRGYENCFDDEFTLTEIEIRLTPSGRIDNILINSNIIEPPYTYNIQLILEQWFVFDQSYRLSNKLYYYLGDVWDTDVLWLQKNIKKIFFTVSETESTPIRYN